MIIYNMRYRGPYEYDKMVLNVLQYHNTIHEVYESLHKQDSENIVAAQEKIDTLNDNLWKLCSKLTSYKEAVKEL